MRITNLNPAEEIGASAWVIDLDPHRLLLDAGTHPKREGRASLPLFELLAGRELDAVAISHCHHDHVGSLPVVLRLFPQAHVLMTELSYFLIERVLHNSVNVMTRQREELGIAEYPLYTHGEVDELAPRLQGFRYNRQVELHPPRLGLPPPTVEFYDAGHALGSAGIMVRARGKTLFYTGDVSFQDQTLLRGARFEGTSADVLILETTRGNRGVPSGFTREREIERLTEAIQAALKRRGTVLIPTFALGRTQEVLALLALLMRSGRLRRQPVYIGGLGRVFTEIYDLEAHRTYRHHGRLKLTEALDLVVLEKQQARQMKLAGGRLCVLTAGMMTERTPAHDLAARLLGSERHAILFVGHADPDTPGGRLKRARLGESFHFSGETGQVTRHCEVQSFDLSAHAARDDLVAYVGEVAPRTVVLGHGEPDARAWVGQQIRRHHPGIRVVQPGPGERLEV